MQTRTIWLELTDQQIELMRRELDNLPFSWAPTLITKVPPALPFTESAADSLNSADRSCAAHQVPGAAHGVPEAASRMAEAIANIGKPEYRQTLQPYRLPRVLENEVYERHLRAQAQRLK